MSDTVDVTVKLKRPPDGMEWKVSEFIPQREYYAGKLVTIEAVLRPIVPATVMVEMPREDAEYCAGLSLYGSRGVPDNGGAESHDAMILACRAALARKPEPLCGKLFADCACVHGISCQHDRNCTRPLGHKEPHAEVKPCPVMVCGLRQTACYSDEPDRCLDRRPCKHKDGEGHGGGHE